MKAAWYTQTGPAREVLKYGDLEDAPQPGAGEVRVKLATSGVNPSDWKVRKGGFGRPLAGPLIIPHSDGAGRVDSIGPGAKARLGDRVWVWNGQWMRPFGTAAEYIVLPQQQVVPLPDGVELAEGACLGIPLMTATQAVHLAEVGSGSNVLIAGGAGSVGHYAIQLAKLRGARVITTVSSAPKAAHAFAAGADDVINYRSEDVGSRVSQLTGGRGVDAAIEVDLSANAASYPSILAAHARVAVYGTAASATIPSLWMMQKSVTLRPFLIYDISTEDRERNVGEIQNMLAAGKLSHTIARRLPLERIAEAHELVERAEVIGNVILEIPSN